MKILIVSGFLGAGKTTFIKELIRRTGKKAVILENEYGDNDIDSRSIAEVGELKILEFMEGCVCCTKKDSFVNSILAVSASLDPEYLIVEPTGVGKLGSILESLNKIAYEKIQILSPVVVLCPRSINEYLASFKDIYKDQVSHAGQIVFSKIEHEDPDFLKSATDQIRTINETAPVINTPYVNQDDEWWNELLDPAGEAAQSDETAEEDGGEEIDVEQITIRDGKISSPGELIVFLEDVLRGRFGNIPRAKGVLQIGDEWIRFDVADGLYAITGNHDEDPVSQCVFIGRDIERLSIERKFNAAKINIPVMEKENPRNSLLKKFE